jgi:hypothetical protein
MCYLCVMIKQTRSDLGRFNDEYTDDMIPVAVDVLRKGGTIAMCARALNISMRTLQRWRNPSDKNFREDFAHEFERAHAHAHAIYDEIGIHQLRNPDKNFNAVLYQMIGRCQFGLSEYRKLDLRDIADAATYSDQTKALQKLLSNESVSAVELSYITKALADIAAVNEINALKNEIAKLKGEQ